MKYNVYACSGILFASSVSVTSYWRWTRCDAVAIEQIVVEEFLEDINNILNSGEVPNLFEPDEFERNIIGCRPGAKEAGIAEGNRDAIYEFFINRVRFLTVYLQPNIPLGCYSSYQSFSSKY